MDLATLLIYSRLKITYANPQLNLRSICSASNPSPIPQGVHLSLFSCFLFFWPSCHLRTSHRLFISYLFFSSPPENPLSKCVKLGSAQYSGGMCGRGESAKSKRFQRGRFTALDNKLSLGYTFEKGFVHYFVCLNMTYGISQKGEVTHIFKMSAILCIGTHLRACFWLPSRPKVGIPAVTSHANLLV